MCCSDRCHYYKYQALGNDYIVIDPNIYPIKLTKDKIKLICDRNKGIGSDGILLGPFFDNEKKIHLKIFNPDGSEAEKSGNGIRIFSQYLYDAKYVTQKGFKLQTLGGEVDVLFLEKNKIQVKMGKYTFQSSLIPVSGIRREVVSENIELNGKPYSITCLSIGNPHCVLFLKDVNPKIAKELGPVLETHHLFPNRINVQFVQILDRNNIKIEIWERGVGYTLSSGTSSCAATCAAFKLKFVERNVNVHMQGGTAEVYIDPSGFVYLTGIVKAICKGFFASCFQNELEK